MARRNVSQGLCHTTQGGECLGQAIEILQCDNVVLRHTALCRAVSGAKHRLHRCKVMRRSIAFGPQRRKQR